jgi:hypothetical protein
MRRFPKVDIIIYLGNQYNKDVNLSETASLIFNEMVIIYKDLNVRIKLLNSHSFIGVGDIEPCPLL